MIKFQFQKKSGATVEFVSTTTEGHALFELAKSHSSFGGKKGEVFVSVCVDSAPAYLVGLGKEEKVNAEVLRLTGFKVAKKAKDSKESEIQLTLPTVVSMSEEEVLEALAEGILQAEYRFSRKSEAEEDTELTVNIFVQSMEENSFTAITTNVRELVNGIFLARDLVNETSNTMYPEVLAERVEAVLVPLGVEVEIYDKAHVEELGMQAFLAVAQGSDKEPRLIVMKYQGNPSDSFTTALVGKGLTYDSGGYCIKTPGGMLTMHADMGGAGTVIGTMYALAKNQVKANVVAVVAACENLISGHAFKTGDIIGSLSGKTIEVLNTDAEGRLTLADAVYYASKHLAADRVIDLATLTGAAVVALSDEYTAALCNDEDFFAEFKTAADAAGEKVWLLPNDEDLAEKNRDTKVADLLNSPGRGAGTITAGQFIGEFLAEDIPWIHLDIAGTAYFGTGRLYYPERATGYHVKSLYNLLNK